MQPISPWISIAALLVSLASFGLSLYVFYTNNRFLLAKTRSDLLTKIRETQNQYRELNHRYRSIAANAKRLTEKDIDMLVKYKEFENNTDSYYQTCRTGSHSAAELESVRHHIEGMLMSIAADMKRLDEWEGKKEGGA